MPDVAELPQDREKRLRREAQMRRARPVVYGMDEAPPGAREVSREEFERIRRGRPVVDGLDVEIGEAVIEPDAQQEAIGSLFAPREVAARPEQSQPTVMDGVRTALTTGAQDDAARASGFRNARQQRIAQQSREWADQMEADREYTYEESLRRAYDDSLLEGLQADNRVNALGEGVVQGLTLGFGDELGAAARSATGNADSYELERNRLRRNVEQARTQSPGAFATGEITGSALPALAIPGGAGRTLGARALHATGVGAGFGGLQRLGQSQEETFGGMARDTLEGAGTGAAFGLGGQMLGELAATGTNLVRPREPGTPEPGRDFTPEQRAQINADTTPGGARDMDIERARIERAAQRQRVLASAPGVNEGDLARVQAEYDGGIAGLARDMDEGGISRRRSLTYPSTAQRQAEYAARETPAVAGLDDVAPEPAMPQGARAGQFADDELSVGPARTAASDAPRVPGRSWVDDLPQDPGDRVPFDPSDTLEAQMRNEFAREGRNTSQATREGTAAPRRNARRIGDTDSGLLDFSNEAMYPNRGTPLSQIDDGEPVIAYRAPRPPERPRQAVSGLDEEPLDFSEGMMAGDRPATSLDDFGEGARQRQRANILAAERREARGGSTRATHDDRTWPVRMQDVEDITPAPREPASPPPLPPRPPAPRQAAPAVDLGRWEPPVETAAPAPAQAPSQTPRQRAGEAVRDLGMRGELAREAQRGQGTFSERAQRAAQDYVVSHFTGPQARAAVNELRSDVLADRIVRRLQENAGTRRWGVMLERDMGLGGRSFGMAVSSLMRRDPDVAQAVTEIVSDFDADYVPPRMRTAEEAPAAESDEPRSEWDEDYVPFGRSQR